MLKVKKNVLEEVVKQLIKEGGLFVQYYETSPFESYLIELPPLSVGTGLISVLPGTWEKYQKICVAVEEHC